MFPTLPKLQYYYMYTASIKCPPRSCVCCLLAHDWLKVKFQEIMLAGNFKFKVSPEGLLDEWAVRSRYSDEVPLSSFKLQKAAKLFCIIL